VDPFGEEKVLSSKFLCRARNTLPIDHSFVYISTHILFLLAFAGIYEHEKFSDPENAWEANKARAEVAM